MIVLADSLKLPCGVAHERDVTVKQFNVILIIANTARRPASPVPDLRMSHFARPHLLIVDELGYLPLERQAGHLLFHPVRRRYEKGGLLLTLLENALNHGAGGVSLVTKTQGHHLLIQVANNGQGLESTTLRRLGRARISNSRPESS